MRDAFVRRLTELAARDERVFLLTADLGIKLFDELEQHAPGRVLNVGIAEQAMVGVAAGLAYAGKLPFAYSIAPFVTSRVHDQVRVDVALARANVKLVGVGGGVAYGYLGPTHHAIEDLALMRALPGMTILSPTDYGQACAALVAAAEHAGPVYIRLQKEPVPVLHDPAEVGQDAAYAQRSATHRYRTTPLRALWQHPPYFHDGSAPDLPAVVDHYDRFFGLGLTAREKADLVEFLKTLTGEPLPMELRTAPVLP
jgi:deoxyxylulose-5-phosphate synthase